MRKFRFLIVDDNGSDLEALGVGFKEYFGDLIDMIPIGDYNEALGEVKSGRFDLYIIDINLTQTGGMSFEGRTMRIGGIWLWTDIFASVDEWQIIEYTGDDEVKRMYEPFCERDDLPLKIITKAARDINRQDVVNIIHQSQLRFRRKQLQELSYLSTNLLFQKLNELEQNIKKNTTSDEALRDFFYKDCNVCVRKNREYNTCGLFDLPILSSEEKDGKVLIDLETNEYYWVFKHLFPQISTRIMSLLRPNQIDRGKIKKEIRELRSLLDGNNLVILLSKLINSKIYGPNPDYGFYRLTHLRTQCSHGKEECDVECLKSIFNGVRQTYNSIKDCLHHSGRQEIEEYLNLLDERLNKENRLPDLEKEMEPFKNKFRFNIERYFYEIWQENPKVQVQPTREIFQRKIGQWDEIYCEVSEVKGGFDKLLESIETNSKAQTIQLEFKLNQSNSHEELIIQISDDGIGFDKNVDGIFRGRYKTGTKLIQVKDSFKGYCSMEVETYNSSKGYQKYDVFRDDIKAKTKDIPGEAALTGAGGTIYTITIKLPKPL